MSIALTYNKTTIAIALFKATVVLGLSGLIYDKLWSNTDGVEYLTHFRQTVSTASLPFLILCVFLAPFNWILESKKWQLLTKPFQSLSGNQVAKAVLSGITLGVLTPSRLGEYGGRLMHIKEGNRGKALYAHMIGSLSQNIPIILFGALGFIAYFSKYYMANIYVSFALGFLIMILALIIILLYTQHASLTTKLLSHPWLRKFTSGFEPTKYDEATLGKVAIFSLARYAIYALQYLLLLYLFHFPISFAEGIVGITLIYLFQTGLPLPPALSVIARTQLALIVWSVFGTDYLTMLSVPVLLWMINLLIPAIMGSIILLTSNIQKQIEDV